MGHIFPGEASSSWHGQVSSLTDQVRAQIAAYQELEVIEHFCNSYRVGNTSTCINELDNVILSGSVYGLI